MTIEHYHAATKAAAIVAEDWMGVLKLTGPERHSWLQGMVTNEVEKLRPGEGCYAGHLNAQGKLVAQMIVLAAQDEIWLLCERAASEKLAAAFDRLIVMEDVQARDVSDEYAVLGLLGLQAGTVLETWSGKPAVKGLYHHESVRGGRAVFGDLGYELIVPRDLSEPVLHAVAAAGAAPIDVAAWNVLRIEAGLPLYGVDIDETTVLPELGQRGISYDKGCYIGQEVVARIKYLGHVNRRFVGMECDGNAVPEVRSVVRSREKEVGYVTSSSFSPALGKVVALGFVGRAAAEPGTAVELAGREARVAAHVAALPFLTRRGG